MVTCFVCEILFILTDYCVIIVSFTTTKKNTSSAPFFLSSEHRTVTCIHFVSIPSVLLQAVIGIKLKRWLWYLCYGSVCVCVCMCMHACVCVCVCVCSSVCVFSHSLNSSTFQFFKSLFLYSLERERVYVYVRVCVCTYGSKCVWSSSWISNHRHKL